jgi:hypothetical protein
MSRVGFTLAAGDVAIRARGYGLDRFSRTGLKPALLLDGTRDKAYVDGARMALETVITTGAAGVRSGFNVAGDLVDFPAGKLRRVKDPLHGAAVRSETGTQNQVRNSSMAGAVTGVLGSGGALPTNWSYYLNGVVEIVETGTTKGISYVDLKITGNVGNAILNFDTTSAITAAAGDIFTGSFFAQVIGGSLTNVSTLSVTHSWRDGSFAFLSASAGADFSGETEFVKREFTATAPASAGAVLPQMAIETSGVVDFTIRIGAPQWEKSDHATSYIATTGAAASRFADDLTVPAGTWFDANKGTVLFKGVLLGANGVLDRLIQIGDGAADRLALSFDAGLSSVTCGVTVAGVSQGSVTAGTYTPGDVISCAMSWNGTLVNVSLNGAAVQSFTATAMPALAEFDIGNGAGADSGSQLTQVLACWSQEDADLPGLSAWAM